MSYSVNVRSVKRAVAARGKKERQRLVLGAECLQPTVACHARIYIYRIHICCSGDLLFRRVADADLSPQLAHESCVRNYLLREHHQLASGIHQTVHYRVRTRSLERHGLPRQRGHGLNVVSQVIF